MYSKLVDDLLKIENYMKSHTSGYRVVMKVGTFRNVLPVYHQINYLVEASLLVLHVFKDAK